MVSRIQIRRMAIFGLVGAILVGVVSYIVARERYEQARTAADAWVAEVGGDTITMFYPFGEFWGSTSVARTSASTT